MMEYVQTTTNLFVRLRTSVDGENAFDGARRHDVDSFYLMNSLNNNL